MLSCTGNTPSKNYEHASREFMASMGDAYPESEPTPFLHYDPVGHDAYYFLLLMVMVKVVGGIRF